MKREQVERDEQMKRECAQMKREQEERDAEFKNSQKEVKIKLIGRFSKLEEEFQFMV